MKFTLDIEEKKILIHQPFTKKDLEHLFTLLNIENINEFVIDKYVEQTITYPNTPNQPNNPFYPDWESPIQPYITYTSDSSFNVNSNIQHTTSTLSELLENQ